AEATRALLRRGRLRQRRSPPRDQPRGPRPARGGTSPTVPAPPRIPRHVGRRAPRGAPRAGGGREPHPGGWRLPPRQPGRPTPTRPQPDGRRGGRPRRSIRAGEPAHPAGRRHRMSQAMIAGTGMTCFGRFLERSVRSLATEAVQQALDAARVAPDDVGMIFFGNAVSGLITGQETIRGQVALLPTGLLGKPIVNVDNACASSSSAAHMAIMAVRAGAADVALAVGAEKLTHEDKTVTFRAFASAIDLETLRERAAASGEATDPASIAERLTGGGTRSNFMDIYAATAREYMQRTGASAEDFARIAVKSRRFGSQNPRAQFHQPVTVDE